MARDDLESTERAHARSRQRRKAGRGPALVALAAAAAIGLGACSSASGPSSAAGRTAGLSKTTVDLVDSVPSANAIGEYVAEAEGYYKDEGLTVNITPAATSGASVEAVAAGRLDLTWSTIASVAGAVSAGGKAQVIMPTTNGIDEQMVFHTSVANRLGITGKSISDLQKLRGSKITIGVTRPGGGIQKAVQLALDAAGLKLGTDYTFENFQDVNEMAADYNSGKIDAFSGISPQIYQIKEGVRLNYGALSPVYQGMSAQVQMASSSLIQNNPDTVQAYVTATWRGIQYARDPAHRAEVISLLEKYTGLSPAYAETTWTDFLPVLPTDPCVTEASFTKGMQLADVGLAKPLTITYSQLVNPTFCSKAKAAG